MVRGNATIAGIDEATLSGDPASLIAVDTNSEPSPSTLAALGVSLTLSACGGGSTGGGGSTSAPPPPPAIILPTRAQAGRFLGQASMGSSKGDIDAVAGQGYAAWLDAQFAMPRATSHWDWLIAGGYGTAASMNNQAGFDPVMWRQLIAGGDQLRQRVGMALLDFLVVGIDGVDLPWKQFAVAAYVDVLMDGAFGNFRTLMQNVSLNVAMGYYLTFAGNRKANPATGAVPDENYARELMQLFTIGLIKLNADGTAQTSGGVPAETYGQDDITGLARVFTGWNLDSADNSTPDRMRRPMVNNAGQHESGAKAFLGTNIPAGTSGPQSLSLALDAIFAHANVAPFISKQLIQRLVTSNPPPAYVARISAVFENNGSGVRGDLKAVVRAILMDVEARSDAIAATATEGKLREPIMRLTGWARAFGASSPSGTWPIGDTSSSSTRLAQSPGRSQSVFNFFRPGYTPPNSAIASAGLVAPEFQITNEPSVIAYVNYMAAIIANGSGDFKADYSAISALATDSAALIDEVDILLGASLGAATKASIKGAVDSIAAGATANRVYTAILLTLAAPEYLVQK
jgi:uncharacterized protein (DUF1800 family)